MEKRELGEEARRRPAGAFFRRKRVGKPSASMCAAEWRRSRQRVTLGRLRGPTASPQRLTVKSRICGANPQYICHELSSFPA